MPVVVEPSYNITMDGKNHWVVKHDMLTMVQQRPFVRLRSWDRALITMIASVADVQVPTKSRPSLANCPGYISLRNLRNVAAASELSIGDDQQAAMALFGEIEAAPAKPAKAHRKSAAEMADLRMHRQTVEAQLQADGGFPFTVLFLKPGHPNEDVAVLLDPEVLDHVFHYIAEQGVSVDDLLAKRQYGSDHGPGVWRNGSAGFVRKLAPPVDDDDLEGDDSAVTAKKPKYESVNKSQKKITDMFGPAVAPKTPTDEQLANHPDNQLSAEEIEMAEQGVRETDYRA